MNEQRADAYMIANAKCFEGHLVPTIREKLADIDDRSWNQLLSSDIKDPNIMMLISFLGGMLGIDRFILGDTGLGIAKLLTCGGLYIWWIVDLFLIRGATKQKNLEKLGQIPDLGISYVR